LLAFQRKLAEFDALDVQVLAASADSCADAARTLERYGLTFRVGCALDARRVAGITGAFFNDTEGYLHATGFIVNPKGEVANAVYSSSAIGRLVPEDCLGLIKYLMLG
jgi:peroxiredoxin